MAGDQPFLSAPAKSHSSWPGLSQPSTCTLHRHGRARPGHPRLFTWERPKDVDARLEAGHDGGGWLTGRVQRLSLTPSWPGLSRPSTSSDTHPRAKTWMPGTRPGMTVPRSDGEDITVAAGQERSAKLGALPCD